VKKKQNTREDAWIIRNVSSLFSFIACIVIAPAIILQQDLLIKIIQFGLLLLLLVLNKKQLHLKGSILFIIVTVLFNLSVPTGRVLITIFGFPITLDAIESGCGKALTLLTLLYLSKLLIYLIPNGNRRKTQPTILSRYRDLLDKTLFYFTQLLEQKKKYPLNKIWESLDEILMNTYKSSNRTSKAGKAGQKTTGCGIFFLVGICCINWYFIVIQYINSDIFR